MKPGRTMAAGSPRSAVVLQDEGLGLGLGAGVGVERAGRRRDGLVGAVMVATLVDAQRADVHESLDLSVAGRVEEQPEGIDVEAAEFCERAPVAHLGRTVEDPVGPGDSPPQRFGVLQVSRDLLDPPLVEPAGVAAGADQRPDAVPSPQCLLGGVAADQPGRSRDEDGPRLGGVHETQFSSNLG